MAEYINRKDLKFRIDGLDAREYGETPEWNDGYFTAIQDVLVVVDSEPSIDIECCIVGTICNCGSALRRRSK